MGADIDRPEGRGPYVFRIRGTIYHLTGALRPESGQRPKYSQMYIIDGQRAIDERTAMPENENCRRDVMEILNEAIGAVSPYVRA